MFIKEQLEPGPCTVGVDLCIQGSPESQNAESNSNGQFLRSKPGDEASDQRAARPRGPAEALQRGPEAAPRRGRAVHHQCGVQRLHGVDEHGTNAEDQHKL